MLELEVAREALLLRERRGTSRLEVVAAEILLLDAALKGSGAGIGWWLLAHDSGGQGRDEEKSELHRRYIYVCACVRVRVSACIKLYGLLVGVFRLWKQN